MITRPLIILLGILLCACTPGKIKENINKTGDAAGQAIGEFTSGVTTGVKKVIDAHVTMDDNLKNRGISLGKVIVTEDSASAGNESVLIIYMIFNKDFNGTITAKAFDNRNLEMGRTKLDVEGKKDDARYFEFHFDRRTDIDKDSKLTIE
jgi:hypothetical protein